jgi:heptosyltransferase-2
MRRVLLIRLSSLGDILLTTPLLDLLQAACPQARVDVLVKAEYRDLLRAHPGITRLLTFDSRQPLLHTLRRLRTHRYDLALDLHCTPRSQLLLRGLRARRKLTYNKRVLRRALLVRLGWNTLQRMTPVPELYAAPLRRLGLTGRLGAPTMHLDPDSVEAVRAHIDRSLPGSPNQPLLAVAPGARWPTKRWPVERFAAVAQELAREKQAAVVILGSPDEAPLACAVRDRLEVPVVHGVGILSLMHSAAVLSRCRLLISNDSGLMHMATALQVPVVAIFGPTVQEFGFYPFQARAEVVSEPLSCRPCSTKGSQRCPRGHHACMQDISSARVLAAARAMWERNRA